MIHSTLKICFTALINLRNKDTVIVNHSYPQTLYSIAGVEFVQVELLIVLPFEGMLLDLPTNIRIGWKGLTALLRSIRQGCN